VLSSGLLILEGVIPLFDVGVYVVLVDIPHFNIES
jgi:hypothetical protein